ncbi:unnamed protein product [Polarella glacialis]|uniref:Phosphatidate cytidylyltransferase, mitochondrial n=1 Tax=Polarella glacialis TaxID=89957 RepID=A0A813GEA8_POLGL|nr:unnamed protein product [Polarella glacialis]
MALTRKHTLQVMAGVRTKVSSSLWPLDLDLKRFPAIDCVIGYGSGVFRQAGYNSSKRPMVDLVFVVPDARVDDWHRQNLSSNPDHYSGLRLLGAPAVACVQRWGPGLYYNPHVSLTCKDGGTVEAKYGVVSREALMRDLKDWSWLYMAGRMHKPFTLEFPEEPQAEMLSAVASNRRAALSAAVLTSGWSDPSARLSLSELLCFLVRLSFDGDIRLGIAENPNKVSNIVAAQATDLWDVYLPIALDLGIDVSAVRENYPASEGSAVGLDVSPEGRRRLFLELPDAIQRRAAFLVDSRAPWEDGGEVLRKVLRGIVRESSLSQTAKGLLTAGPARGARYALQKLRKRFAS